MVTHKLTQVHVLSDLTHGPAPVITDLPRFSDALRVEKVQQCDTDLEVNYWVDKQSISVNEDHNRRLVLDKDQGSNEGPENGAHELEEHCEQYVIRELRL